MYSCNNGTKKIDWRDCQDVSSEFKDLCKKNPLVKECYHNQNNKEKDNDKKTKVVHKTTIIRGARASASATATANAAEESSCRLDGSANGIQQMFDTAKYQTCGLYPNG